MGLSPPTRGNPLVHRNRSGSTGSIPAHAGEPVCVVISPPVMRVYPRPRGGTQSSLPRWHSTMGLSPPTRGNRKRHFRAHRHIRSIPAHAGEPGMQWDWLRCRWVYPRPRGGTCPQEPIPASRFGLSPAHAGEPPRCSPGIPSLPRSIPAHAGGTQGVHAGARGRRRSIPAPRGGTTAFAMSPPFS